MEGAFAQMFNSSDTYVPYHHSSPSLIRMGSTITTTAVAFWKNSSFAEHVLWEISGASLVTKLRGIKATCSVSGDRRQPRISSHSLCEQQNLSGSQRTGL